MRECEDTGPVCGCDGQVHTSQCAAQLAGVDLSGWACQAAQGPVGSFPCGIYFCDAATEVCRDQHGDACDHWFACEPRDPACPPPGDADCGECLIPDTCDVVDCTCDETPGNGVTGITVNYQPI
jgi:hypothetical protein